MNEDIVRHAYGECLARVARLAPYGELGSSRALGHEVTEKQSQLALDDLIHLAISLRRLSEACGIYDLLKNVNMPEIRLSGPLDSTVTAIIGTVSMQDATNRIVHSRWISIVNYSFELIDTGDVVETLRYFQEGDRYRIKPICFVKSDKGSVIHFQLSDYCLTSDRIMSSAVDRCAEDYIFIEQFQ